MVNKALLREISGWLAINYSIKRTLYDFQDILTSAGQMQESQSGDFDGEHLDVETHSTLNPLLAVASSKRSRENLQIAERISQFGWSWSGKLGG